MNNWDAVLWILIQFSILSLVIERSLYVVFEWSMFGRLEEFLDERIGTWFDVKPPISIAFGILAAFLLHVDLVGSLFSTETTVAGMIITGLYVAGGSKATFIMFDRLRDLREAKVQAQIYEAVK